MTAPGWYPDPSGTGQQRYWDGTNWGPVAPPPATPAPVIVVNKKKPPGCLVSMLIALAVVVGGCTIFAIASGGDSKNSSSSGGGSSGTSLSADRIERLVIRACQDSARDHLKDPDSAKFGDDWKARLVTGPDAEKSSLEGYSPARGDKLYTATGSVNAKNAFGGYVGQKPVLCNAYFTNDDKTAHASALLLE